MANKGAISIELGEQLRSRVKVESILRRMSTEDYIIAVLRRTVDAASKRRERKIRSFNERTPKLISGRKEGR